MSHITIKEAEDRYSCNVCKCHSISPDGFYDLNFGSVNVCLCENCVVQASKILNDYIERNYLLCQ